jgi:uncharacterized membrane protein
MLVTLMTPPTSLAGRAVPVLRRRFPALFGAAVWPYLLLVSILVVINIVVRHAHPAGEPFDPAAMWRGMSFLRKLGVMLSFVAGAAVPYGLAMAGTSIVAYEDYRGGEDSLGSALKRVVGRVLSLVVLSFLVGCGTLLGSFLFVLPGMLVPMFTVFAIPVMLVEDAGVGTALRRSLRLAWDRIGTILVFQLILGMVWMVVSIIFASLLGALGLEGMAAAVTMWAFLGLSMAVVVCVYGTVVAILYHDIRVSRGELQPPNVTQ